MTISREPTVMNWAPYQELPTRSSLTMARRLGERAGHRFVTFGTWPRNPFGAPGLEPFAAAWSCAMFKAVGQERPATH